MSSSRAQGGGAFSVPAALGCLCGMLRRPRCSRRAPYAPMDSKRVSQALHAQSLPVSLSDCLRLLLWCPDATLVPSGILTSCLPFLSPALSSSSFTESPPCSLPPSLLACRTSLVPALFHPFRERLHPCPACPPHIAPFYIPLQFSPGLSFPLWAPLAPPVAFHTSSHPSAAGPHTRHLTCTLSPSSRIQMESFHLAAQVEGAARPPAQTKAMSLGPGSAPAAAWLPPPAATGLCGSGLLQGTAASRHCLRCPCTAEWGPPWLSTLKVIIRQRIPPQRSVGPWTSSLPVVGGGSDVEGEGKEFPLRYLVGMGP